MDCEDAMISNPYLNQNKFPPNSTRLGGFFVCCPYLPCQLSMFFCHASTPQKHCKKAPEVL